jgi:uncharacterized protein YcfL
MEKFVKIITSMGVLIILGGCAAGAYSNQVDKSSSNIMKSKQSEVIINNIPLSYKVSIDGYDSKFTNDLLDVFVKISNKDGKQYPLEYKFKWYDEAGFEVNEDLSFWKPFILDAYDEITLRHKALTSNVETFKFYIREKQ